MKENFSDIQFERYADDIIVHCVSENQAYFIKNRIEGRLNLFKLELNAEKTNVVYTGRETIVKIIGSMNAQENLFF